MTAKRCSVPGCEARAWHGATCNLHALLEARARREAARARSEEECAQEVRERAAELGLTLDEVAEAHAPAGKKVRSPVS